MVFLTVKVRKGQLTSCAYASYSFNDHVQEQVWERLKRAGIRQLLIKARIATMTLETQKRVQWTTTDSSMETKKKQKMLIPNKNKKLIRLPLEFTE